MGRFRALAVAVTTVASLGFPLLIGTLPAASAAVYHEWSLSGVTFDDGGTLSGTIVIADDGSPYSEDVTTAGGNAGTFGTFHYAGTPSPLSGDGFGNGWYLWAPEEVGQQYLNLKLPDTTTSSPGDSLPLPGPNASWECTNCSAIRYVNAGSITEGDVVDFTPPDITPTVTPPSPDGLNGWYVGSPTVTFAVTDDGSDISDQTGCGDELVDGDTTGVTFTCQATSLGGTNSQGVTLKRDATPPVLAPIRAPAQVLLHGPITVSPHATDATSGVASAACTPTTATAGVHTAVCTAADNAGNTAQSAVHYTVQYVIKPITVTGTRRSGHVLTLATQLTDAGGTLIPNAEAAALGCRVKSRMVGARVHHGCFTYDPRTHRFTYAWTLRKYSLTVSKHAGSATITASVSYPHSSVRTSLTRLIKVKRWTGR